MRTFVLYTITISNAIYRTVLYPILSLVCLIYIKFGELSLHTTVFGNTGDKTFSAQIVVSKFKLYSDISAQVMKHKLYRKEQAQLKVFAD